MLKPPPIYFCGHDVWVEIIDAFPLPISQWL
jgi:hypothetical protein